MSIAINPASGVGADVSQSGYPYTRIPLELKDQGTAGGGISSAALALLKGTLAPEPGVPAHDLDVLA